MDGVELFDAGFFNFLPREAELTDPQQKIFLEIAWEALESAGYDPAAFPGDIAVYAGSSIDTYLLYNVLSDRQRVECFTGNYQVAEYPTLVGNGADFIATRTAYKLDLRGPAFTVQSACSTSLLAVAEACQCLLDYRADMAIAGGVSITFPAGRKRRLSSMATILSAMSRLPTGPSGRSWICVADYARNCRIIWSPHRSCVLTRFRVPRTARSIASRYRCLKRPAWSGSSWRRGHRLKQSSPISGRTCCGPEKSAFTTICLRLERISIDLFRIAARMRELGFNLDAADLMRHPTIAELAIVADMQPEEHGLAANVGVPSLRSFRRQAGRSPA